MGGSPESVLGRLISVKTASEAHDKDLSSVEQALVDHVCRGAWLDLAAGDQVINEASMRSWGDARTCRAFVVRDILLGRLAPDSDPHGLRLRGARIRGPLDLENVTTDVRLEFSDCLLEEGVFAADAQLVHLGLRRCWIGRGAGSLPGGLLRDAVRLARVGAVDLTGAHIAASLDCSGATLRNGSGPALSANRLRVDGAVFLGSGFTAEGHGGSAVSLIGARIAELLDCSGAILRNEDGPALSADGLQVGQAMFLRDKFNATGTGRKGTVRLTGAHIGDELNFTGARLQNDTGPALFASGLQVGQSLLLRGEFTGAGGSGAVHLMGAHIAGSLNCSRATLCNDSGPALSAGRLQVDQAMFLYGAFTGSGGDGAVRLTNARIVGSLNCSGAILRNEDGPALSADGVQVGQAMFLRDKFNATGTGQAGAVRLTGAHIGDELNLTGALLQNDSGPALFANGLQVGQSLLLRGEFTGAGGSGAVHLMGAHIAGSLNCSSATLRNDSGPAFLADRLQVDQAALFAGSFISCGNNVIISLKAARINGTLMFTPKRLEHKTDPSMRLEADGLTYSGVPEQPNSQAWLKLLRDGTPRYAAQPYQQLAAGYRGMGDDQRARQILITQRDDQLARAESNWTDRLWGRMTKVTLGYGYQPWRALVFLAAVLALSCMLAVVLGSHGALTRVAGTAVTNQPCTAVQKISVGLDLNLPVGTTLARAGCGLAKNPASVTASWLAVTGWALRLFAWAFAALFVAGFTTAVRKT